MLKVLFILHYPPPVHGSAVVGKFVKESKAFNNAFHCRFINLGLSANIQDIGRNSLRKFLTYLSLIYKVKKQILFFRPNLCYFTPTAKGIGFYKDALIVAIVRFFRVKIVFHYHNKGVSQRQDYFFDNLLYRFIYHNSPVILLSGRLYPDIRKYVPQSRVFYCPNGIPDQKEKRHKKINVNKNEKTHLLFLSHHIRSKGVLVLIEACSILKDKKMEFRCTIAGSTAELATEQLKNIIINRGLEEFVSASGPKYGEEKTALLKSADILVHPSYNDCLPLILLEAMQFSLPVVSTYEGAIPDAVEDGITGFLVPPKNSEALSEKLSVLILNPELRVEMGIAGRIKYEKEFTLEIFENRMIEILKECLNKT